MSWKLGSGPTLSLACLRSGPERGAAIVGFALPGEGSCVSAYSARSKEPFDELCEQPGSSWTIQCERPGCVHYFDHGPGSTVLDGPVGGEVRRVRVVVGGRALRAGWMFAPVRGRVMHAIRAEEPFGFFFVFIPRCVEPDEVEIELYGVAGSRLGEADRWDVAVERCRHS